MSPPSGFKYGARDRGEVDTRMDLRAFAGWPGRYSCRRHWQPSWGHQGEPIPDCNQPRASRAKRHTQMKEFQSRSQSPWDFPAFMIRYFPFCLDKYCSALLPLTAEPENWDFWFYLVSLFVLALHFAPKYQLPLPLNYLNQFANQPPYSAPPPRPRPPQKN